MNTKQVSVKIRCPNCGAVANTVCLENNSTNRIIQTSCYKCDYFMVSCSLTGKVLEAYAPGLTYREIS